MQKKVSVQKLTSRQNAAFNVLRVVRSYGFDASAKDHSFLPSVVSKQPEANVET
jgi:hypothetical protein